MVRQSETPCSWKDGSIKETYDIGRAVCEVANLVLGTKAGAKAVADATRRAAAAIDNFIVSVSVVQWVGG